MELQDLYNLIEANLDNKICDPQTKMGKFKRVRLPIPKEYGGGIATGWGYEDAIRNLIGRIQSQFKMEAKAPLFEESWSKWIELKQGQKKSESTIAAYKWLSKTYILPFFKDKHMDEISSDDIQRYFNSIMNLSESISTQSKAILRGVFDRAIRQKEIENNPMIFKYERSRKKGNKVVLQDSDLVACCSQLDLLKDTDDIRDYLYFSFLCFTSLRRGEILGLRWSDVDFEKSEIHVRSNVTFPNGQNNPVVGLPKDESLGTIHLNSELSRRIKPYVSNRNNYILPYSTSVPTKPMTKSMFVKLWKRISSVIDMKGATSHSFRASYVTMMNAHCEHIDPKVLQSALRHKTPDLAIKMYTKKNDTKTKIAEEEYDNWLSNEIASQTLP